MREQDANHQIEIVGKKLRDMMSFLQKKKSAAATPAEVSR